jgi:hypothetical protein
VKVARIKLWDGSVLYTDTYDFDSLSVLFDRAREKYRVEGHDVSENAQIDLIEMEQDEYFSIPATNFAHDLLP